MSHGAQVGVPVGFSAVLLAVMLSASASPAMPNIPPAATNRTTTAPTTQDAAAAALIAGGIASTVGQLPPVAASADAAGTGAVRVATDTPPMPAVGPDMASLAPVPPLPGTMVATLADTAGAETGTPTPAAVDSSATTVDEVASLAVVPGSVLAGATTTASDGEQPVTTTTASPTDGGQIATALGASETPASLAAAASSVPDSTVDTSPSTTAATPTTVDAGTTSSSLGTDARAVEPLRRAPSKRPASEDAGSTSIVTPSVEPSSGATRSLVEPAGGQVSSPLTPASSTGVYNVDRIRYVRAMAPNREVQRLALDLDGARISVRMDGGHATVGVVSDPDDALGGGWVRQVERTLEQTVRATASSAGGSGTGSSTSGSGARQQGDAGYDAQQRRAQAQTTWVEHSTAAITGLRWAEAAHHLALQSSGGTTGTEA